MAGILKYIVMVLIIAPFSFNLYAQSLKIGGQLGYAKPQGSMFESAGEKLAKGGVSLDLDAMYYMEKFESKLGLGINYNTSFLFGQSTSSGFDIGIYGLSLYAVKVNYNFFNTKVTPYVSLSTGLAQLSTPQIKDGNNNVLSKSESSFAFGLRPEVGLDLGGFTMSVGYIVPMKYDINSKSAGVLQLSLGLRYKTF